MIVVSIKKCMDAPPVEVANNDQDMWTTNGDGMAEATPYEPQDKLGRTPSAIASAHAGSGESQYRS